jgi:hypothetical protein
MSSAPIQQTAPALEFTEEEFRIVRQWTRIYDEADKAERYSLLKSKILPQLYPFNANLPSNDWKVRKSVSATTRSVANLLIYYLANKALVSKPVPNIGYQRA